MRDIKVNKEIKKDQFIFRVMRIIEDDLKEQLFEKELVNNYLTETIDIVNRSLNHILTRVKNVDTQAETIGGKDGC